MTWTLAREMRAKAKEGWEEAIEARDVEIKLRTAAVRAAKALAWFRGKAYPSYEDVTKLLGDEMGSPPSKRPQKKKGRKHGEQIPAE